MQGLPALTQFDVIDVRKRLGLSQKAFAEALGTTLRNVQYWEAGDRQSPQMARLAFAALLAGLEPWK